MSKAHVTRTKKMNLRKIRESMNRCAKSAATVIKDSFKETSNVILKGCCNDAPMGLVASDCSMLSMSYPPLFDCFPAPIETSIMPLTNPLFTGSLRDQKHDRQKTANRKAEHSPENVPSIPSPAIPATERAEKQAELSDLIEILQGSGQEIASVEEMESGVIRISVNDLLKQAREKEPVLVRC